MKIPIKKDLTDQDMLGGYEEKDTFETSWFEITKNQPVKTKIISKNNAHPDSASSFFSKELQEDVSKALLELKVKLYKEGILDYTLKVSQEGRQIILTAFPADAKSGKPLK